MPFFHSHHHRLFYREQGSGELLLILPGNGEHGVEAHTRLFRTAAGMFFLQVTEK
jgi:hypothetical protein